MGIGSLQPDVPADNVSAGGGNEELKNIKEQIQVSFPNWDGTDGNDILQATATEVDEGVGKANTAVQTFNGRNGPAITPQTDDYDINQIDDSMTFVPVPAGERSFTTFDERAKLANVEANATNNPTLTSIDDVAAASVQPGQFLVRGPAGDFWVPTSVWQPDFEYVRLSNPAEDTNQSNTTIKFNTQGGLSDYGDIFSINQTGRLVITMEKNAMVMISAWFDAQMSSGPDGIFGITKNVSNLTQTIGDIYTADSSDVILAALDEMSGSNTDRRYSSGTFVGYLPAGTTLRFHCGKNMQNLTPNDGSFQMVALNRDIL